VSTSTSQEDLVFLANGVIAGFYTVAFADGKIQYPESNAFGMMLKQGSELPHPDAALTAQVFGAIHRDLTSAIQRVEARLAAGATFADLLEEARSALERAPKAQADVFLSSVVTTLQNVATVYPIFARGPDRDEAAAIERVAAALGVSRRADHFAPFQD
jgi:hypothetical protein